MKESIIFINNARELEPIEPAIAGGRAQLWLMLERGDGFVPAAKIDGGTVLDVVRVFKCLFLEFLGKHSAKEISALARDESYWPDGIALPDWRPNIGDSTFAVAVAPAGLDPSTFF